MSNHPSLKKDIIIGLLAACKDDSLKGHRIILFTAYGMISGLPSDEMQEGKPFAEILVSHLSNTVCDNYREEFAIDGPIPGNDGHLILQDAILSSGSNTYTFKEIVVFYDQIIAATIGNVSID